MPSLALESRESYLDPVLSVLAFCGLVGVLDGWILIAVHGDSGHVKVRQVGIAPTKAADGHVVTQTPTYGRRSSEPDSNCIQTRICEEGRGNSGSGNFS